MNYYTREYIHEIKDEYIKNTEIFIYDLNVDYSNMVEELYSAFEDRKSIFKINAIRDIPSNLRKLYPEYGFFVHRNKVYSISKISDETLESIKESLRLRMAEFIDREAENLKSLNLNLESLFSETEIKEKKTSLYELEELKELNINIYKNLLKSKVISNICLEPMELKYRKKVDGNYQVFTENFDFLPIHGKNGEAFASKFFEAKKEKGIVKIKADIKEENDKMYFEYTLSFSEIVKHPIKDTDLYASAWKDNPKFRKQRTFYCKKDNGYVPVKIRKVYSIDKTKYEDVEELDFMFEFDDFLLSSEIEYYLGYSIKELNEMLKTPGTENQIFLQNWSQASRQKPFGGSGLTFHDKYYISEHILKTNKGLGEFREYEQCDINNKKAFKAGVMKREKTSTCENGVDFERVMLRKPNVDKVNIYVFKNSEEGYSVDIAECVKSFIKSPVNTVKVNLNEDILLKVEKYNLLKSKIESGIEAVSEKDKKEFNNTIKSINTLLEKQNKGLEKEREKVLKESIVKEIDENTYETNIVDSEGKVKSLLLKLHIIDDEDALDESDSQETVEERLEVIKDAIGGEFEENSMALIELENLDSQRDAKSIIRKALNSVGVINQFINPNEDAALLNFKVPPNKIIVGYDFEKDELKYEECNLLQDKLSNSYSNKVRKAMLDMLSDFGFTDSTFAFNEYTCYSFGVIDFSSYTKSINIIDNDELNEEGIDELIQDNIIEKEGVYIPAVVKMTDDNILVKLLVENSTEDFSKWIHISEFPKILNLFKIKSSNLSIFEKFALSKRTKLSDSFKKVSDFITEDDASNKILLLSHKNCGKLDYSNYKNIFKDIEDVTLIFTENEDTHYSLINPEANIEDFVAFTLPDNYLYKVDENTYKCVGLKPFGIQMIQHGHSRVIPTNSFKCRRLFKIEILKNKTRFNNEALSYLVYKTRTSLTTNRSLSSDILTEHIYSSIGKHLK